MHLMALELTTNLNLSPYEKCNFISGLPVSHRGIGYYK